MQCYQQLSAANHSEYVGCILLASNLIISILAYLFYLSQGGKVVVWCFCSLRAASSPSQCEFIWSDIAYCTSWLHSSLLTLLLLSIYTCYCSWWWFQILRDLKHWNTWLMIKDSFLLSVVMCEGRWCVESRAGQLQIQMTFIQSVSSVDNPRQGRAVFWPSSLLTLIMITESHSLVCRKIVGWN